MLRKLIYVLCLLAALVAQAYAAVRTPLACFEVRSTTSGGLGDSQAGGGFAGNGLTPAPSAPSVSNSGSGGSVAANTYYVVVVYGNPRGESPKSAQTSTTTSGSASTITVTSPSSSTYAGSWSWYCATTSGGPYYQVAAGIAIGTNSTRTTTPPTSGTQAPGVDYSQQNAFQLDLSAGITSASVNGTITFVGYTPTAADVGNIFQCTGGVGATTGFYEILGWSSSTWTISVNQSGSDIGTSAAITGYMGGALASPGQAGKAGVGTVSKSMMWVGPGTYTMTSTSNNVSLGQVSMATGGSDTGLTSVCGYHAVRGDNGAGGRPVITTTQTSASLFTTGSNCRIENIIIDGNAGSGNSCVAGGFSGSNRQYRNVKVQNSPNGFTIAGGSPSQNSLDRCEATTCSLAAFSIGGASSDLKFCEAYANTCPGFVLSNAATAMHCLSYSNTGGTTNGFTVTGDGVRLYHCVAYANGQYGFSFSGNTTMDAVNCVAVSNTLDGFYSTLAIDGSQLLTCAGYGNGGGGNYNATLISPIRVQSFVALGADPFTASGSGDFSLNATSNGGTLLKAAGFPGVFPAGTTTGHVDVGAAQSAAAGAGGGLLTNPGTNGGTQ